MKEGSKDDTVLKEGRIFSAYHSILSQHLQDALDSSPNLDLLDKLESSPLYFTRYRGLFRECFKGEKTDAPKGNDFSKYNRSLVTQLDSRVDRSPKFPHRPKMCTDLSRLIYYFSRALHVACRDLVPQSQLLHPGRGGCN